MAENFRYTSCFQYKKPLDFSKGFAVAGATHFDYNQHKLLVQLYPYKVLSIKKTPSFMMKFLLSSGSWTRTSDLWVISWFYWHSQPIYKDSKRVFLAKLLKNVCVFVCAIWLIIMIKILHFLFIYKTKFTLTSWCFECYCLQFLLNSWYSIFSCQFLPVANCTQYFFYYLSCFIFG